MKIKYAAIGSLLSLPLLASEIDLYSRDFVKYKGVEILNFYIPVEEKNKFRTYIDFEKTDSLDTYVWNIGEGYLEIDNRWELEYDVERKFYKTDNDSYQGWNNNFTFVKSRNSTEFLKRTWDSSFVLGLEQETLEDIDFSFERYKLFVGNRFRTAVDFGMGGTYLGFDVLGKKVFSTIEDGWAGELNFVSSTTLGYGFQFFNTIYNEYLNYDNSEGYRIGLESYLRWTHELSLNFAFAFEVGIDIDKYLGKTDLDYNNDIYFYPYILYSYNFNPSFRVFGELGLPGYKIKESKAKVYDSSESGIYYYGKFGLEYIF